MVYTTKEIVLSLIRSVSMITEVQSIGISGGMDSFPRAGEGDIDIFIYCDQIPDLQKRQAIFNQMGDLLQEGKINVFAGGHWGVGDFGLINGIETWLMYFTIHETSNEVESILNGDQPDKLDNYYYPVGRCAMLKNMSVFYDKNDYLQSLKQRLMEYPDQLANTLVQYHIDELDDQEDLERAMGRSDVLFYHFALDLAMDHFLQALFAMNRTYFPSRKRTLSFIENFSVKPEKCSERLLEIVRLGSYAEGIRQSFELWIDLVIELKRTYEGSL